jgi:hypothetical protein
MGVFNGTAALDGNVSLHRGIVQVAGSARLSAPMYCARCLRSSGHCILS